MIYLISLVGSRRFPNFLVPVGQASTQAGYLPISDPLDAKGTLINGAFHPRPISKVVDGGIDLFFWNIGFCPVEYPSFIRTGCDAVPAADAPVVIDHHESIGFLPGRMDRAYLYAGRVLAVLALNREIKKPFLWDLRRIIVMLGVIEFDEASPLESENPDPLKLVLGARVIIFFYTRVDAPSASDASGKIEAVSPEGVRNGLLCADLEFFSVFLKVSLLQFGNDPFLIFRRHLLKTLLQEVLGFLFRAGGEKRDGQTGQCGQ